MQNKLNLLCAFDTFSTIFFHLKTIIISIKNHKTAGILIKNSKFIIRNSNHTTKTYTKR